MMRMNNLFFAIFPDSAAAAILGKRARQLRTAHKLAGTIFSTDRFHVSLHSVGQYEDLPQRKVTAARKAGDTVTASPFEVAFDRAESFSNRHRNSAFVLRGSEGVATLIAFQHILGVAMVEAGLGRFVNRSYTPHVTLLYDDRKIEEHPIEAPIKWTVRDFVLVQSLVGRTQYKILDRWPLKKPATKN